ncbi:hypothetical protein [Cohnella candidum]|uniref:Lipoprotein n=1 Tax=Cohnella candidum TaxID=2674991 RepID=A0A3G3JUG1_9BACL|nr:hypothetical protein [Cohnella candidum]AYQ71875.1 hypothetical protein EAV92_04430 [Cohnella candidum]
MLRRFYLASAALLGLSCLSGCMGYGNQVPADKAFAMSASALAGSESYGFAGEVAIYDPSGTVANQSRYQGEVTGHGNLNLKWSGGQVLRAKAAEEGPSTFHPMELLKAIQSGGAKAEYDTQQAANGAGDVRLRLTLVPETARNQIANSLKEELDRLRTDLKGRKLTAEQKKRAEDLLTHADSRLDAALATLKVQTVCLWTADPKTWFPRQMTEQTQLAYTWNGKPYSEKRVSVTDFLPAGRSVTMGKNAHRIP